MADIVRFLKTEIEVLVITELDADGFPLSGGKQWVTCCDIDSVEIENDQEDRERYTVPNANRRCRVSTTRQAILYGKIVRIGFVGESPFADALLLGSRLNLNGSGDVVGAGHGDYECKFVSVVIVAKSLGEECAVGAGGQGWYVLGKVGDWSITQAANITNSNEVGVTIYEGVAVKNPNFATDANTGEWLESPAQFDPANEYDAWGVYDWTVPDCADEFIDLPVTDSSSA